MSLFLRRIVLFTFFLVLVSVDLCSARAPLLQDGKKSVYQRVVTHPGAMLYADASASTPLRPVKTFTVMYIYGRDKDRVEVGVNSSQADGWIDEKSVTVWPQALTMVFTDRMGRKPVLFFRNEDALIETCRAQNIAERIDGYLDFLQKNPKVPESYPVLASEPLSSAVSQKNFYLLPVLGVNTQFSDLKLVEVASLNPGNEVEKPKGSQQGQTTNPDLRIGFAFVIDTSISMGPYIEQTVALIRDLYNRLEKSPHADKMAFAVVAFRSDVRKTPKLEYTAKVICDFTTVADRKTLETALQSVSEAKVSSHDVNEDSFAGVLEAAEKLSWDKFGSRVMLLVTDAGPLAAGDPTSKTGLTPAALRDFLKQKRIYLTCAHVKNAKNLKNEKYAEGVYEELTMQGDNQASYIDLNVGAKRAAEKTFRSTADTLAQSYTRLLTATATGQFLKEPPAITSKRPATPEEKAARIAETTGYAMLLQFYGDREKASPPHVVNAWIADADLSLLESNQSAPVLACEPSVLLTKRQLSKLYEQVKTLLYASEEAFLNGDPDLFAQIKSAAAQMSRDPNQFTLDPDRNLVENNLLDDVLEGLPYKSEISTMTRQDWESMTTGERKKRITRLKSLLNRYEGYDRDVSNWESFGASDPDDSVYRVPLSMLP
ncbi:MAG: VWA domain-containing protein [Desulfovibrionaceae bacterium]|nr:VWA domain-containing protein [Desulfovibrionaceae bacterium]